MSARPRSYVRDRAYIRARARGLSIRQAAKVAGFYPDGSCRIERRLFAQVEYERKRLAGYYRKRGILPNYLGKADQERLLLDTADV